MTGAKTPILHGVAQGDIDMAGYRLLNLDLSTLASGAPFSDATALIKGSVDPLKLMRFEVDGLSSAKTIVLTVPDFNGTIATLAGAEAFTNKLSFNGVTLSGTGGALVNAVVSLTGGLLTEGDISILSAGELILRAPALCDVTLPASGTLARLTDIPTISDVAYDATSWNGNLDGASKDKLRDKFESLLVPPFDDDKTILFNNLDATKLLKISLAGLTTATTRTLTVQDKNGTIACLDDIPDVAGIIFSADEVGRQLSLSGDVSFFGKFTLAGGFDAEFTLTAATSITLPTEGTVTTRAGEETLTNKTINEANINSAKILSVRSSGADFDLALETAAVLTSNRKLILALGDANRTLTLGNNFSTSGNFPITLTVAASSNLVLPATGEVTVDVGVPANAGDSGVAGQRAYDSSFEYRCVALNTWKRVAIATW